MQCSVVVKYRSFANTSSAPCCCWVGRPPRNERWHWRACYRTLPAHLYPGGLPTSILRRMHNTNAAITWAWLTMFPVLSDQVAFGAGAEPVAICVDATSLGLAVTFVNPFLLNGFVQHISSPERALTTGIIHRGIRYRAPRTAQHTCRHTSHVSTLFAKLELTTFLTSTMIRMRGRITAEQSLFHIHFGIDGRSSSSSSSRRHTRLKVKWTNYIR